MMKIIFFGTPDFSVPTLKALINNPNTVVSCVVTQPDRPQGRGQLMTPSPIKKVALEHNIPVLQPENIKKEKLDFINQASKFGPFDAGIVIAFGQILPQSVLDLPRCGCINIHGSLLPRWRGAAPMQRAIMAGDTLTGVDLMKMEAGLDTGPIYAEDKICIGPNDTLELLHDQMSELGAKLLNEKLFDICSERITATPQAAVGVTYAHKIENNETKIDWSKSALEIHNTIRALSPIPGAFTTYNGKRIKIFETRVVAPFKTGIFKPGQITTSDSSRLEVMCGAESVSILSAQIEGKKRMFISEVLKGFPLSEGDFFV